MYPEARYSPCGITSYLPDSLGKLIKMNKVPVVVAIHHGNYLHAPVWNVPKKRKVPLYTQMKLLFTEKDVNTLSVDELNARLREAFVYDEYQYQKENGILVTEPYRAEGMHKILYHCPHCMTESRMNSKGAELYCEACGKRWVLNEDGTLTAKEGKTEFSRVPDWFRWEREQTRNEILEGRYLLDCDVKIGMLVDHKHLYMVGEGHLRHDLNGFTLTGCGGRLHYTQKPLNSYNLNADYYWYEIGDIIGLGTKDTLYYCFPKDRTSVAKARLATEEMYKLYKSRTISG
jgi:DNA-directed RNA polymerase subunit RPC12/RpoP